MYAAITNWTGVIFMIALVIVLPLALIIFGYIARIKDDKKAASRVPKRVMDRYKEDKDK